MPSIIIYNLSFSSKLRSLIYLRSLSMLLISPHGNECNLRHIQKYNKNERFFQEKLMHLQIRFFSSPFSVCCR